MKPADIYRQVLAAALISVGSLSSSGCFIGDENNWASRAQIVEAAETCGVPDFEPQRVGGAWSAHVPESVPEYDAREDCIYDALAERRLLVTR